MKIGYQEYAPSAALQPYVESYCHHVLDGKAGEESPEQYCLPLGMVEIIHTIRRNALHIQMDGKWEKLPHSLLVGIWEDKAVWKACGKTEVFVIRLKPEALLQLFKIPASVLYMKAMDLEAVFGSEVNNLTGRLDEASTVEAYIGIAEDFLLNKLQNLKTERNYLYEATKLIRESKGVLSIDELSENLYISKRQLQRSFKEQYGTSPKTYQRIIRFSNAYHYFQKSKTPPSWADISYSFGYADQAHFIRDFKDFTGDVPSILCQKEGNFYQRKNMVS